MPHQHEAEHDIKKSSVKTAILSTLFSECKSQSFCTCCGNNFVRHCKNNALGIHVTQKDFKFFILFNYQSYIFITFIIEILGELIFMLPRLKQNSS